MAVGEPFYFWLHVTYRLFALHCPRRLGGRVLRRVLGRSLFGACGANLILERGTVPSARVKVGDRVQIGANTRFMIGGGLTLCDDVLLAPEVVFIDINHQSENPGIPIKDQGWLAPKPITIGAGAWIGFRAMILPGVEIGGGAVVGAGAVVTRSIPSGAIAVGNPAAIKGYRPGMEPKGS